DHPQPVPPIYQPEVAARGVVYAADHPNRKQYSVGGTTAVTITAQKLIAPLLDRYLARTGYTSQQTDKPVDPDRPSNLWQPVDATAGEDFGAHGIFDSQAHSKSMQMWVSQHVRTAGVVAVAVGSLVATNRLLRRSPAKGPRANTRLSSKR
ncbi:MAG TPA: hypothetical protein VNG12_10230, partial [Acidimicrobiales bacterium]|nr:hypothetical protein [Acidimicrobiales bacterium]